MGFNSAFKGLMVHSSKTSQPISKVFNRKDVRGKADMP